MGKRQVEMDWLKKDWTSRMSVQEKRACIEAGQAELSIARQCELIELLRASYYREITLSESQENLELMHLIDEEYTCHPFYGRRKMRAYLNRLGYPLNRKRVQRLRRKMGAGLDCSQAQC
jgi:putative transposase